MLLYQKKSIFFSFLSETAVPEAISLHGEGGPERFAALLD